MCVSIAKFRPCTAAEALAYKYLSTTKGRPATEFAPQGKQQQGFVDERDEKEATRQGRASKPGTRPTAATTDEREWSWMDEPEAKPRDRPVTLAEPSSAQFKQETGEAIITQATPSPMEQDATRAQTSRQREAAGEYQRSVRGRLEEPRGGAVARTPLQAEGQ